VIPQELEDKIDSILRKCKCSKVSVVTVAGDEPDTDQTNTFQELDGGIVYFVDCSGDSVLINPIPTTIPTYASMALATAALGAGKLFQYSAGNVEGATTGSVHVTQ
jgi:hypothetical protein